MEMNDTLLDVARFAFVFILPVALTAGAVVAVFTVGALFYLLDHPEELRHRVEAAFRHPPKPPRSPGPDHYYKPYWSRPSSHQTGEE